MKYQTTNDWRYTKIMNDLVNHLFSFRRLTRKKIIIGSILFLIQATTVFVWSFISAPQGISPASSIAIALLFLFGSNFWPTVFFGTVIGMATAQVPPLLITVCALSYTLQGTIAVRLLKHFEFNLLLARFRDSLLLISILVGVSIILPIVNLGMEFLFGIPPPFLNSTPFFADLSWGRLWIAGVFINIIFTPLLLRWSIFPHKRSYKEILETTLVLSAIIVISILLFWSETRSIGGISLAYLLIIPLFWTTLRLGPRLTVTSLALSAGIAISIYVYEAYQGGLSSVNFQGLYQTELFFTMLSFMFLLIVSIEEERKEKTKELEEHVSGLRTEIRELSDDDRLKNEFIATLAHELRNPLAPVVSTLELLLLRKELSREATQLVKRVQHQTETVKRLLDDLLDVSRITQKKFKLRKEQRMLSELLAHCEGNAEHIMRSHNHTFTLTVPKEDVTVYVDPTRFEQIVINLLYNAAKYTESGGTINLNCVIKDKDVVIKLKDTGIGIEPESLEQIFLPFRQMRTHHHAGTGLGIGLAITKQLVEMHGGTIVAHSEGHGKGSEFVVTLPIIDTSTPHMSSEKSEVALEKNDPLTRTILVVDDNEDAAKALARLLEFRGHTVYVAHSGKEAIENTRLFKPEVILLDIGLPDLSGYQVAQQLRQSGVHAKIIAVTGYGQENDRMDSEDAGFDHHLVKPVSLVEVEQFLS
jgi:signal transduction histidine kinase